MTEPAVPSQALVERWQRYFGERAKGVPFTRAARNTGIEQGTARRYERGVENNIGRRIERSLGLADAKPGDTSQADLAVRQFNVFRQRYFGRVVMPWHEQAAHEVVHRLSGRGGQRQFLVMNMPSGSGKTTLLHDLICWMLVRDRTIRILSGARSEQQAKLYLRRVRRSLERTEPVLADPDLKALGITRDARATLTGDFGAFRPDVRGDLWSGDQIVVRGAERSDEKEASVAAFGADSAFLGGRYDLIIWDDLVDKRNLRTPEARERLWEWFTGEAESRLEPGGVLLLVGQRMAPDDLYSRALTVTRLDGSRKYQHVLYPAHDERKCEGEHEDVPPQPAGCLLDPIRLPWAHLQDVQATNPNMYELMFQQRATNLTGALVREEWLTGGENADGERHPGCYDTDRLVGQVPRYLTRGAWSVVTVDPSPAQYWAVQWWGYHYETESRVLLDQHRERMEAGEFLSWDHLTKRFTGVLQDWVERAAEQGFPIQHVIVEGNAAQRFLLQTSDMRLWMKKNQVTVVAHSTNRNKADPKYGVHTIGVPYKYGKVRLPWAEQTQYLVRPLLTELLGWPDQATDDCVMANWFLEYSIPRLAPPPPGHKAPQQDRPQWLSATIRRRGIATAGV
jgi:hypothetical protein